MPNRGSTFYALNRNKRSLAVDLKSEAGREIFTRLVRGADILLDNYAPGVLERLGFGYMSGLQPQPGIIYCAIKGFLPGPYGDRPFLDELAQMMGSMAYMTGAGRLGRCGRVVGHRYFGAATYGVLATLAALVDRQRTGRGQRIQAGLFETQSGSWPSTWPRPASTVSRRCPCPSGAWGRAWVGASTACSRPPMTARSSSRSPAMATGSFCTEFGLADLAADPALDSNAKRAAHRDRTIPRIEAVAASLTAAELMERMERVQVPLRTAEQSV